MNQKLLLLGVIFLILVGVGGYMLGKKSPTLVENKTFNQPSPTSITEPTTQSSLTLDQIFSESSSQLGINRSELSYFRIFGQDRIQYSFSYGTNFAYRDGDKWQLAGEKDAQGIGYCSELNNLPEQYRPVCYDSTTGKEKYMNSQRQSLNYPPSQMTSYIGE